MSDVASIRSVLFGAGGHASVVVDSLRAAGADLPVAIIDANSDLAGTSVFGIPVEGTDKELDQLILKLKLDGFVMGLGSIGDSSLREQLFRLGSAKLRNAVTVIHPTAIVSPTANIASGAQIFPGAIVNSRATIGQNVIVNSGAIVEHDCNIGDHVHVAPGAVLAGSVTVGQGSHIGCGATVLQSVSVGKNSIVGAGAVVTSDVVDDHVVVGVPARKIRRQSNAND